LSQSPYRDRFVLKGGMLLAKYLPIGRETKDLDFFIQHLSNAQQSLEKVLQAICRVSIDDSFTFELTKIEVLEHVHMAYTGAEISLLAQFGATQTIIRMDLGFGDVVEPIDYPIDLMATAKGPLFEQKVSLRCYPKEFIFAEKLETIVFRGGENTRMKDFHDLYTLISLGKLGELYTQKAIELVFNHRKTSLQRLPVKFDSLALEQLQKGWEVYCRRLKTTKNSLVLPGAVSEVVEVVNEWLGQKTDLCKEIGNR